MLFFLIGMPLLLIFVASALDFIKIVLKFVLGAIWFIIVLCAQGILWLDRYIKERM